MSTKAFEHFYRGKHFKDGQTHGDYTITAHSSGLTYDVCQKVFEQVYVGSHSAQGLIHDFDGFSCALWKEYIVFAYYCRSDVKDRGHYFPQYHIVLLPISTWTGDIIELASAIKNSSQFTHREQVEILKTLQLNLTEHHIKSEPNSRVVQILDHILYSEFLNIIGFDQSLRLVIIQSVLDLLPISVSYNLTFSTDVFSEHGKNFDLSFSYYDNLDGTPISRIESSEPNSPYIKWLSHQPEMELHSEIKKSNKILSQINNKSWKRRLNILGAHQLVVNGDFTSVEANQIALLEDDVLELDQQRKVFIAFLPRLFEIHEEISNEILQNDRLYHLLEQLDINEINAQTNGQLSHILTNWISSTSENHFERAKHHFERLSAKEYFDYFGETLETNVNFLFFLWSIESWAHLFEYLYLLHNSTHTDAISVSSTHFMKTVV